MKVLVSTNRTQGQRTNDFCFVPEGELVMFGFECDGETVDGPCGCHRSMVGIHTRKGTTTMTVTKSEMTIKGLSDLIFDSLVSAGWGELRDVADQDATILANTAEYFPTGAVVEKRGNRFRVRKER